MSGWGYNSPMSARTKLNQGMNWIRKEKRLAIYLHDGLACAYCESALEDCERLTLDHLTPHSRGGSNDPSNLVTCCLKCNSIRADRAWQDFARDVARYLNAGIKAQTIINSINKKVRSPLNVAEAKEIMERRGGFTAALRGQVA